MKYYKMKTNQEILDEFGKLLINDVLDRYYKNIDYIVENGYKNPTMLHYNELFLKLNEKEKRNLIQFILENIKLFKKVNISILYFLCIFASGYYFIEIIISRKNI